MSNNWNISEIEIAENIKAIFLDIEVITPDLIDKFDAIIAKIYYGDLTSDDISFAKIEILERINTSYNFKIATISEFLMHFVLREKGFNQYSLLSNLEESKSMKKGLDGVYIFEEQIWLSESKATSIKNDNIEKKHIKNITEAHRYIKELLRNPDRNNIWKNALNHAQFISVPKNEKLITFLDKLSKDFKLKQQDKKIIEKIPLISVSTIFLYNIWPAFDKKIISKNEYFVQEEMLGKNIVIFITQKNIEDFNMYLKI